MMLFPPPTSQQQQIFTAKQQLTSKPPLQLSPTNCPGTFNIDSLLIRSSPAAAFEICPQYLSSSIQSHQSAFQSASVAGAAASVASPFGPVLVTAPTMFLQPQKTNNLQLATSSPASSLFQATAPPPAFSAADSQQIAALKFLASLRSSQDGADEQRINDINSTGIGKSSAMIGRATELFDRIILFVLSKNIFRNGAEIYRKTGSKFMMLCDFLGNQI